jgi:hypothetical protein
MQLYCYFVSQPSEFCRHNTSCCSSTSVYYCCCLFRYRISPETFGYTLVYYPTTHHLLVVWSVAVLPTDRTVAKPECSTQLLPISAIGHSEQFVKFRGHFTRFVTQNMSRWRVVSPIPNPQAWGPPFVACLRLIFQHIRSCLPYAEVACSIRNPRMFHVVVKGPTLHEFKATNWLTDRPTNSMKQSPSWEAYIYRSSKQTLGCYETWDLIIVFTKVRHWPLFWERWNQSTPSYAISLRYILILWSCLFLGLPSGLSIQVFQL